MGKAGGYLGGSTTMYADGTGIDPASIRDPSPVSFPPKPKKTTLGIEAKGRPINKGSRIPLAHKANSYEVQLADLRDAINCLPETKFMVERWLLLKPSKQFVVAEIIGDLAGINFNKNDKRRATFVHFIVDVITKYRKFLLS